MATITPALLRLRVADAEDLAIVSAALQDAVLKVGDIRWAPKGRTLTLALNRYRWESAGRRERVRSALQLGSVLDVKARRIRREAKAAVLNLLSLRFEPAEAPGGKIVLAFAGGGDLSVEVECLDAVLVDVSGAWPAKRAPRHADDAPLGRERTAGS
jgi:hypothetical protein